MHIEYLKYYVDFCKTKSISKTAEKFFMTPQGVSRALHQLEDEFGASFFIRKGNQTALTDAGELFHIYAIDMLSTFETAKRNISHKISLEDEDDQTRQIQLICTPCTSSYILDTLLGGPATVTEQVRKMQLRESNLFKIFSRIQRSDDPCIGLISYPRTDKYRNFVREATLENGLTLQKLICTPLTVLLSASDPLAQNNELSLSDLEGKSVVCLKDDVLLDALDDFIREDQLTDICSNPAVLYSQLYNNNGCAFIPAIAVYCPSVRSFSEFKMVPFGGESGMFSTCFALIAKPGTLNLPGAKDFINILNNYFMHTAQDNNSSLLSCCLLCSDREKAILTPPPRTKPSCNRRPVYSTSSVIGLGICRFPPSLGHAPMRQSA